MQTTIMFAILTSKRPTTEHGKDSRNNQSLPGRVLAGTAKGYQLIYGPTNTSNGIWVLERYRCRNSLEVSADSTVLVLTALGKPSS